MKQTKYLLLIFTFIISTHTFANSDFHLVKDNTLTVCTLRDFTPMIYKKSDGKIVGYEVDILQQVAKKMNVALEYKITDFDNIWKQPKQNNCDIAAAGLTVTSERIKDGAKFTSPHFYLDQSVLIRTADKNKFHRLNDFVGKKIGIVPGTTGESVAREHAPEGVIFVAFDDESVMLNALTEKKIDGIARGNLGNGYQAQLHPEFSMIETVPTREKIAFALADNNEALYKEINNNIKQMKKTGILEKIYHTWFKCKAYF